MYGAAILFSGHSYIESATLLSDSITKLPLVEAKLLLIKPRYLVIEFCYYTTKYKKIINMAYK